MRRIKTEIEDFSLKEEFCEAGEKKENKKEDSFILNEKIRPLNFKDYIGQDLVKKNIETAIKSAKIRNDSLEHLFFYGPPGLGKTTVAYIIANEMNVNIKTVSAPSINTCGEMVSILNSLNEKDILFIDEIHRLDKHIEEVLYSAMEDFTINITVGKAPEIKVIELDLPKFTLIGATTRAGMVSQPLRDRFCFINKMEYYTDNQICKILKNTLAKLKFNVDEKGLAEISKRSRGTPRLANRLLKKIRDFAFVDYEGSMTYKDVIKTLKHFEIDSVGLDKTEQLLLSTLLKNFNGGPVGVTNLSASIGEDSETVEDVYEPFLIYKNLIEITSRGRILTEKGKAHIS